MNNLGYKENDISIIEFIINNNIPYEWSGIKTIVTNDNTFIQIDDVMIFRRLLMANKIAKLISI